MQTGQIFNVDDVFFPEQLPVPGQIIHRINADGIHTDALIISGQNEIKHLIIHTGEISEVGIHTPISVPAQIEQEKICLLCFFTVFSDVFQCDGIPFF